MGTTDRRMAMRYDGIDALAAELEAERSARPYATNGGKHPRTTHAHSPVRERALRDKALAKSCEQVALNNLPRLVRDDDAGEAWSVHSRTNGDVWIVTIDRATGEVWCTCPAGWNCWHRAHVGRARAGDIGYFPLPRVAAL